MDEQQTQTIDAANASLLRAGLPSYLDLVRSLGHAVALAKFAGIDGGDFDRIEATLARATGTLPQMPQVNQKVYL